MAFRRSEARMFNNFTTCFFPDCVTAYGLGMATIVLGATLIAMGQRRAVQRALDRRDAIIKDLQSRD